MSQKTALISVYDKINIIEFCKELSLLGWKIIATGNTAKLLHDNSIAVELIEHYTGFPEILDGRVKTLHPKIYAGILAKRDSEQHINTLNQSAIATIDLVVCNVYPFQQTVQKKDVTENEIIEMIDIGGPSMIRAAAKNYQSVSVLVSSEDYHDFLQREQNHSHDLDFRKSLAAKAFAYVTQYDMAIKKYFEQEETHIESAQLPAVITLSLSKIANLRYGENPHQKAALYAMDQEDPFLISHKCQIQGKELSYNNLLDSDTGVRTIAAFSDPACAIIKHLSPCGVATAQTPEQAFREAYACDEESAFGGIVAINRQINELLAEYLTRTFFEVIIASDYTKEALEMLSKKKNLRLLKWPHFHNLYQNDNFQKTLMLRSQIHGMLAQTRDIISWEKNQYQIVTQREPTAIEWEALRFVFLVSAMVQSNAIVFGNSHKTIAIGGGHVSRVDAVKFSISKSKQSLRHSVVGSDGFFPFRDTVDLIARTGASAIIQPGGSIRDKEVIEACNEHNLAMVFTKERHFRHGI